MGACVIQGFFLAKEIESNYPECVITETHPKALLLILNLKICSKVGKWSDSAANNEHERDAFGFRVGGCASVAWRQTKFILP